MKEATLIMASILFLFATPILPTQWTGRDAFAKGRNKQVVMAVCEANIALDPPAILVQASSSGGGAPDLTIGSECGPVLATLLNSGFEILDVKGSDTGLRVFYILIKGSMR